MGSLAWPIEEVLYRPVVTLVLAGAIPFVTAKVLAALLLPKAIPADPFEAARIVAPFRRAAILVGASWLGICWWLGWTALGPALVSAPSGDAVAAFAWLTVAVAVVAGGAARLVERPGARWADARSAMAVRLRMIPFVLGPVLGLRLISRLPLVDQSGPAPAVSWGWVALAALLSLVSIAWGGLLVSMATGALRRAPAALEAAIKKAAQREKTSLLFALRFPTGITPLANAAAIPWARAIFVTDALADELSPDALDAVLAHEAAHLSEGPRVAALRLSAATVLVLGAVIAAPLSAAIPAMQHALLVSFPLALVLLVAARRVARRMEERADEHAREHVGGEAFADALLGLQRVNRAPMTTGSKRRVHPDLYDRITACGRELGPRPAPPDRLGSWAGLAVGAILVALAYGATSLTEIEADAIASVEGDAALRRQRVDPWDPNAMLALAWDASRADAYDEADARIEAAEALGAPRPELFEARAEVLAARGRCDEADAAFDEAVRARSMAAFEADPFAPLELGGWHLPPSLVSECRRSVEDIAPGPDPFDLEALELH